MNKFYIKSSSRNSVKAVCPCHRDKNASLSLTYDEATQKTLVYCHAGCDTHEILTSVGLTFEDLGTTNKSKEENSNIENIYSYVDENGVLLFEKIRFKNKDFRQRRYIDGKTIWGVSAGIYTETYPGSNNYSPKERPGAKSITLQEQPKILYNLPKLLNAIKNGYPVYIVEGEKDVNNMTKLGLIATTAPSGGGNGNKKWLDSYSKYFKGASVVILPDNDEAGQSFAKEIKSKLKNYAHATKLITISDKPKGDITDWINEGHDLNDFLDISKEHNWDYAPWIYEKNKKGDLGINQGIIADCISKTLDYVIVGNPASQKAMIFTYSNGIYEEISKKALNKYVSDYIPNYLITSNLLNNITELLTNEKTYQYSMLIGDKNIINLKNGLYNVTTGELKPHDSKYISSTQLDVAYNPNPINHGYWDNFIDTLTMGDLQLKNIIQEWYGLILSNYDASEPKKLLLLYGPGDTGKSKLISILEKLLGEENSKSIQVQKLGDRFALGDIFKSRLLHYGDLPSKMIDDSSLTILKVLTGGDTLSVERKGIDSFTIKYRGALMYACNELPVITGDLGKHVFDRFMIIPCNNPIPKEKQNPRILEQLLLDKEYIFNWSMEGLRRLLNNGLKFSYSEQSEASKEMYSLKSDSVRSFINEFYDLTDNTRNRVKLKDLYLRYEVYCAENGKRSVGRDTFKDRMSNIGLVLKPYCGYPSYYGISEKEFLLVEDDFNAFEKPKEIQEKLIKDETIEIQKSIDDGATMTWNTSNVIKL
ncbi:MAG: toprim domain-containing protein [Clostridium sp.]|uniref:phage/plasmid primase, P4 family n=1 Tax=Clostridium paraputrificum TaxID=29363 RepID=UPI0012B9ADCE|nr:phage/plasmid primase, P4 family [Clostridium paraputrificum]MBS6889170.1 toprim domain-containing protein [Clostridium sp.]